LENKPVPNEKLPVEVTIFWAVMLLMTGIAIAADYHRGVPVPLSIWTQLVLLLLGGVIWKVRH
jgi:hypothetical protein